MPVPHDIEAEIRFLATEEGGRSSPVFSGYRAQFYYDGRDWDARHEYPDSYTVYPGESVRAFLGFLSPQEHIGKITVGMEFEIREGTRSVGIGVVTKIIDLPESAKLIQSSDT